MTWASHALDLIARGNPAAMVTLAAVQGSAPRDAGTRMVVSPDAIFGTVGGGNLEHLLIDQARRLMNRNDVDVLQQDYPLGPLLAQCCGGRVRVLVERLASQSRDWLAAAEQAERSGARYTLSGAIVDGHINRTFLSGWPKEASEGPSVFIASGALAEAKETWTRIVEHIAPVASHLYVFGAGHVGAAIVHIAQTLPFHVHWLDSRTEFANVYPALAIRDDFINAVTEAPPGSFFLVLTHAHELDYQLVRAILSRGDARYCGLIGSETKRARFLSRLAKDGVDARGLTCPIGASGIQSKDPACIAVAASSELLVLLEANAAALNAVRRHAG